MTHSRNMAKTERCANLELRLSRFSGITGLSSYRCFFLSPGNHRISHASINLCKLVKTGFISGSDQTAEDITNPKYLEAAGPKISSHYQKQIRLRTLRVGVLSMMDRLSRSVWNNLRKAIPAEHNWRNCRKGLQSSKIEKYLSFRLPGVESQIQRPISR